MRTLFAAGLIALVVPACIVGPGEITGAGEESGMEGEGGGDTGGGDGSGTGTTPTPRIQASVDRATMTTELGKTESLTLTIQSMDGFAGSVPITPAMMDAATALEGFTITATPPTADVQAGGSATVQLSVAIPTDVAVLNPQLKIDLGGTAPTSVSSDLAITNQVTVNIPAGTGNGAHSGLPAINSSIRILKGAKIVFHNSDSSQHVIHADGGINHENLTGGMPNSDYVATPDGNATWYCHTHEAPAQIRRINVVE